MKTNVVLEEIKKELNWKERIIVYIFKKTYIKVYKQGIKEGFNWNSKTVR